MSSAVSGRGVMHFFAWRAQDQGEGKLTPSASYYTLQDRGKGIVAKHLKQMLFGFSSDLIQDGLDVYIDTVAASCLRQWVYHFDGLVDLCERNVLG